MKITSIRPVDDCIDQNIEREIRLGSRLTREMIEQLGAFGRLEFHKTFSRPMFRLLIDNRIHVRGVEGNDHCSVILDRDDLDGSLEQVRRVLESLTDGKEGAKATHTSVG